MYSLPTRPSFAQHFNTAITDPNLLLYRLYQETGEVKYRNDIILRNTPLIVKETSRWIQNHPQHSKSGHIVDFDMLYPEAVIGFSEGLEKYKLEKSAPTGRHMKITSYCVIRIHRALTLYANGNRLIRVPKDTCELKSKMSREIYREELISDAMDWHQAFTDRIEALPNRVVKHGLLCLLQGSGSTDQHNCEEIADHRPFPIADIGVLLRAAGLSREKVVSLLTYYGLLEGKKPTAKEVNEILAHLRKWVRLNNITPTTYA